MGVSCRCSLSPTDRLAAEAVRAWLDWKYLLGLPLEDPGFDATGHGRRPVITQPTADHATTPGITPAHSKVNKPPLAVGAPWRVIHSSYYRVFSDGKSGDWIGEMLSTFPQSKMNIY